METGARFTLEAQGYGEKSKSLSKDPRSERLLDGRRILKVSLPLAPMVAPKGLGHGVAPIYLPQ